MTDGSSFLALYKGTTGGSGLEITDLDVDTLQVDSDANVDGDLDVGGDTTFAGAVAFNGTDPLTVTGGISTPGSTVLAKLVQAESVYTDGLRFQPNKYRRLTCVDTLGKLHASDTTAPLEFKDTYDMLGEFTGADLKIVPGSNGQVLATDGAEVKWVTPPAPITPPVTSVAAAATPNGIVVTPTTGAVTVALDTAATPTVAGLTDTALAGTGTRMVTADATGTLTAAAMPVTALTVAAPLVPHVDATGAVTVAFPPGSVTGRLLTEVAGSTPTFNTIPRVSSLSASAPFTPLLSETGAVTLTFPTGTSGGRVLTEVSGGQPAFQALPAAPVTSVSAAATPNGIVVTPTTGAVTVGLSTTATPTVAGLTDTALAGADTRMVTTSASGTLGSAALPVTALSTSAPLAVQSSSTGAVTVAFPAGSVSGRVLTEVSGGAPTFQTPTASAVTSVSAGSTPNGIIVTPTTGAPQVSINTAANLVVNSVVGSSDPLILKQLQVLITDAKGQWVAKFGDALENKTTTFYGRATGTSAVLTDNLPMIHRVGTISNVTADCPMSTILLAATSGDTWTSVSASTPVAISWGWRQAWEAGYTSIRIELDIESAGGSFWVAGVSPLYHIASSGLGPYLKTTPNFICNYLYTYFNYSGNVFGGNGGQSAAPVQTMDRVLFPSENLHSGDAWTIRIPYTRGSGYNAFYFKGRPRQSLNQYNFDNWAFSTAYASGEVISGLQLTGGSQGFRYRYSVYGERTSMT